MEPGRIGMSWTVEVTHSVHFPIAKESMGRRKQGLQAGEKDEHTIARLVQV